ncbi:MAG: efflux RND transporter periplasmic adaptor subunit [Bacteroidota bacterium]
MKPQYLLILTTMLLMACSKGSEVDQKKAKLEELKQKQQSVNSEITKLEGELAVLQPNKQENVRITPVKTAPIAAGTFKHFIEVQGSLDSRSNVFITPKTAGSVSAVHVKEGDHVRKGQVLAVIDDAVLRQNVDELKTSLELSNTLYEKQKNLWSQKIGSEVQFLQAKNNKESLENKLKTLQSQIALNRITSPINGIVDEVKLKVGETANPMMGAIRVVDPTSIRVIAKVADSYIGSVRKGDAVIIRFPDLNREIEGKINFVGQVVNPTTRTFDIEVAITNKDQQLKPNMLAVIKINDQTKSNAIVIDENIVQKTEAGDIVFVATQENGRKVAKLRKVKTGLSYNGKVEILEGLQAGDQLITDGSQDLADGQRIS